MGLVWDYSLMSYRTAGIQHLVSYAVWIYGDWVGNL